MEKNDSALIVFLLREPQSRTLSHVQTDIVQLLHYASIYTPSQSIENLKHDTPSDDEKWYQGMVAFLSGLFHVLQTMGNTELERKIEDLPWLKPWNARGLIDPLRYIIEVSEFCGLQCQSSISPAFYDALVITFPSKTLPDPSLPIPLSSYIQLIDYNVCNGCSMNEKLQIMDNAQAMGNTILCDCIVNRNEGHTADIEKSLRVNLTIFFSLMQGDKMITRNSVPFYWSYTPGKQDFDISVLNAFRDIWRRKTKEPLSSSILIYDNNRKRKELLLKGSRLSTLFEMTFDEDDQNPLSLQDTKTNTRLIRGACILFVTMYAISDPDEERAVILTALSVIPHLSDWNRRTARS